MNDFVKKFHKQATKNYEIIDIARWRGEKYKIYSLDGKLVRSQSHLFSRSALEEEITQEVGIITHGSDPYTDKVYYIVNVIFGFGQYSDII